MPETTDNVPETSSEALFSVVAGEGDGFMLGVAAGDTAGGAWELGYSAITEQVTIVAYELIVNRTIRPDHVVVALLEMDGAGEEEPVLRAESPEFRMWLDRGHAGRPVPGVEPSLDAAARATAVGVAFRRDPHRLVTETVALGRLFHRDAATVVSGVMTASAVAASCFAQSGMDLVAGVAESTGNALDQVDDLEGAHELATLREDVLELLPEVGVVRGDDAMAVVGGDRDDPVQLTLAGILLAAPVAHRHHVPIEQAAHIGGSGLGAVVGAIVGARVGIRAWPWAFANDTWFAEIGRRLVRGPDEVRDLPIPYAVEQHLMSGGRPGFH